MSDEEAEKAWRNYVIDGPDFRLSNKRCFMAGRASRDAEVAELERQIQGWIKSATDAKDAHRSEVAALRERVAELEAVIEKVREALRQNDATGEWFYSTYHVDDALYEVESTVLAAVKRETAAQALEAGAAAVWRVAKDCPNHCDDVWAHRLRERAAALRSGTEGSN